MTLCRFLLFLSECTCDGTACYTGTQRPFTAACPGQALESLVEFTQGPCRDNQRAVVKAKVIEACSNILSWDEKDLVVRLSLATFAVLFVYLSPHFRLLSGLVRFLRKQSVSRFPRESHRWID
jgi:hypothetical protein